ncbi:MAG TPA: Crp/Fnr family transcriptional regulator [Ktedonobacterales bacterium]|nr:Crp/Fnr family transcriptional regulator [Ktedonobacterales bacterium]
MPVDVSTLRRIPIFSALGSDDLARVAAKTVERTYERGDIVILAGDRAGALYYVHEGLIKIFKTSPEGKEQVLRLIGPGNTFNEVPALDGGPNPASAAAMRASAVYAVGSADLRRLIVERPDVAVGAVRALADALRHLVALVEDLSFRHVTARVAKILLDQEAATTGLSQGVRRLTQQEMAAMAGTAREVVGRALKELEATGAIELRQGHVVVTDLERLRLLA